MSVFNISRGRAIRAGLCAGIFAGLVMTMVMKQLGVGSVVAGQLIIGGLGGIICGLLIRRRGRPTNAPATSVILILLPLVAVSVVLWPVLGTSYRGLPIASATAVTLWSFDWRPNAAQDFKIVVRATDGEGKAQEWEENRPFKSGLTGFHKISVHITA